MDVKAVNKAHTYCCSAAYIQIDALKDTDAANELSIYMIEPYIQ